MAASSRHLLDQILSEVGEIPSHDAVSFSGSDPVLRTPFRVGEAAAAAIGASALQAARLFELRGGPEQTVEVDVGAAALSMQSSRHVETVPPLGHAGAGRGRAGFFQTRTGRWFFYRGVFRHHFAKQLEVLDCDGELESIRAATATWDPFELEEAIAANGAIGGAVRSHAEWEEHPQARAVDSLPLIEVVKIGDSPIERLPRATRPLAGLRVLDVTRVLAGPTCGRTLAEHGAEVLRIGTDNPPDDDVFIADTGHGKRHARLDLKDRSDAEALRRLAASADVFAQGYRPGAMESLGFSPEALAELRPGIVYVTESAFGHVGPWRDRRGFDSLVEAVSGAALELADPESGLPRLPPCTPLDYITGYLAAYGVMVALTRRAQFGGSYLVRLSLARTEKWLTGLPRVDPALVDQLPSEVDKALVARLSLTTETPFGRMRHFAPIAELSVTPGFWELPAAPIGHDPPEWT